MSQHHAKICWRRNSAPFEYKTYPRDHTWSFKGDVEIPASAAPDYLGSDQRVDPEEAYVAALSSCHMLTFLAIAAKRNFVVDSYVDAAVGYLEKNEDGELCITRVALRPKITFAPDSGPTPEQLGKLHHGAHQNCFIANSVKTMVDVED
jgi:organic hydroperoxide reductase OsmC/OhrA